MYALASLSSPVFGLIRPSAEPCLLIRFLPGFVPLRSVPAKEANKSPTSSTSDSSLPAAERKARSREGKCFSASELTPSMALLSCAMRSSKPIMPSMVEGSSWLSTSGSPAIRDTWSMNSLAACSSSKSPSRSLGSTVTRLGHSSRCSCKASQRFSRFTSLMICRSSLTRLRRWTRSFFSRLGKKCLRKGQLICSQMYSASDWGGGPVIPERPASNASCTLRARSFTFAKLVITTAISKFTKISVEITDHSIMYGSATPWELTFQRCSYWVPSIMYWKRNIMAIP
mmetsp:Transcript_22694/g.58031  ORF Transcript_22694/g.58031 Transcript_22694/m.58031 type:complete len:285 (-) Transcript_22694:892-1746(-)